MRFCEVEGCLNVHRAKGLCSTHYSQAWYEARGLRQSPSAAEPEDAEEEAELDSQPAGDEKASAGEALLEAFGWLCLGLVIIGGGGALLSRLGQG